MLNQDVHKNMRRNKSGIRLDQVENLSSSYKRPPGFSLMPTLLGSTSQNTFDSPKPMKRSTSPVPYYNHVKDEMLR